jgi:hypothetical protein
MVATAPVSQQMPGPAVVQAVAAPTQDESGP